MILNTGSRTDIPAFYMEWFMERIRAGCVMARNPYYPKLVHRYRLDPKLTDVLVFCTKDPGNALPYLGELAAYDMFWFVTITPYGKDIEPRVRNKHEILRDTAKLSEAVGQRRTAWRYDPIFLDEKYTYEYHMRAFETMCRELSGKVSFCVISFIDLYEKTKRNFPGIREVSRADQLRFCAGLCEIAGRYGIPVKTCLEDEGLAAYGPDTSGCMTKEVLEAALGRKIRAEASKKTREGCHCLLGNDIGEYNTCLHGCRYCYANYDTETVLANYREHDPLSQLLIGHLKEDDIVKDVRMEENKGVQMRLDI